MRNYDAEELLQVVAELSEKYTSKESTSLSYERARQLMEAVLYCIHQCEEGNQLIPAEGISAKDAYQAGYENVIRKVKKTQLRFNQIFLGRLPEEYVCHILRQFHQEYEKQFFNISSIVARHVLGCMLIGNKPGTPGDERDYDKLRQLILQTEKKELRERLQELLRRLIVKEYDGEEELFAYLNQDLADFVCRLQVGAEHDSLKRIVVL